MSKTIRIANGQDFWGDSIDAPVRFVEPGNIDYPIAEVVEDGTFIVAKPEGSGGMAAVDTVSEQLVYEMGDPQDYITPDVVADFASIRLEQAGPDRVRVHGVKGKPRTPFLKVSGACPKGSKAKLCASIVWKRLEAAGCVYEHTDAEIIAYRPSPIPRREIARQVSVEEA